MNEFTKMFVEYAGESAVKRHIYVQTKIVENPIEDTGSDLENLRLFLEQVIKFKKESLEKYTDEVKND